MQIANLTTDVLAALKPALPVAKPLTRADRQQLIDGFHDGMQKQGVAGYAEIVGDVLTVHSERASALRFHAILANKALVTAFQQVGLTTLQIRNTCMT
ncbi:MAG: hypothetical protein WA510_23070 [Acidobacteriaceae bacterium]